MKTIRIGKAAEQLNISASTLRKYTDKGLLPYLVTPNGQRVFTQEILDEFMGVEHDIIRVFYVRSSNGKQELLDSQINTLTTAYGSPLRVYSDKGSGLNENRKGLIKLLDDAKAGKYNTLCVTQTDRLSRFGFSFIERYLTEAGVKILVLGGETEKTLEEELLQDFMNLLASFSGKFYRLRGYAQQRQLLNKVTEKIDEQEKTH